MKIKDYKKALKRVSKILYNNKIFSCYDYGSYKNPGLSDIDLFLILQNNYNPNLKKVITEIKKGKNNFFFKYSTIIILNSKFFKNIRIFDNLNVNKIFGKKIKIIEYKNYKNELLLLSILEWLPERMMRVKENINNFKTIDIRQHLGLLNSFKYTLINLTFFINSKKLNHYVTKIEKIRKEKGIIHKKKKIFLFTNKLFKFGERLIVEFSKTEKLNNYNFNIKGKFSMSFPNKSKIIFSNKKLKKQKKSICVPLIYSLPFSYHLKFKNSLYKIIKNHLKVSKQYSIICKNKKIFEILDKRNNLLSENVELLKKNNIYKGIYKFGWYLKNEKKL